MRQRHLQAAARKEIEQNHLPMESEVRSLGRTEHVMSGAISPSPRPLPSAIRHNTEASGTRHDSTEMLIDRILSQNPTSGIQCDQSVVMVSSCSFAPLHRRIAYPDDLCRLAMTTSQALRLLSSPTTRSYHSQIDWDMIESMT